MKPAKRHRITHYGTTTPPLQSGYRDKENEQRVEPSPREPILVSRLRHEVAERGVAWIDEWQERTDRFLKPLETGSAATTSL